MLFQFGLSGLFVFAIGCKTLQRFWFAGFPVAFKAHFEGLAESFPLRLHALDPMVATICTMLSLGVSYRDNQSVLASYSSCVAKHN